MTSNTASTQPDQSVSCRTIDHELSSEELAADRRVLDAIATDTRYAALRLIATAEEGVCGCEIEPTLGVSQGAVSQALSKLSDAGLLTRRKEGRWRYYEPTEQAAKLLAVLDETRTTVEPAEGSHE